MMFNFYENVRAPKVLRNMPLDEYVEAVRTGLYSKNVLKARECGKGSEMYNLLKLNQPAVTINYQFRESRRNDNAIKSSGYIMFDFDNGSLDFSTLDKSRVAFIHKSFGGNGHTCAVRVENCNPTNFKRGYDWVSENLGFSNIYDKNARSISQATVISFDPEILYNQESEVFDFSTLESKETITLDDFNNPNLFTPNNDLKKIGINGGEHISIGKGYRFDNSSDYFLGEYKDLRYRFGQFEIVEVSGVFNFKILEGARNNFIFVNASNLKYLNPNIQFEAFAHILKYLNGHSCETPLNDKEVNKIAEGVYSRNPSPVVKQRKIVFNKENFTFTKTDYSKILGLYQKEKAEKEKVASMAAFLEEYTLDEKITKNTFRIGLGMNHNTVGKYWHHFENRIDEFNASLKKKK